MPGCVILCETGMYVFLKNGPNGLLFIIYSIDEMSSYIYIYHCPSDCPSCLQMSPHFLRSKCDPLQVTWTVTAEHEVVHGICLENRVPH